MLKDGYGTAIDSSFSAVDSVDLIEVSQIKAYLIAAVVCDKGAGTGQRLIV